MVPKDSYKEHVDTLNQIGAKVVGTTEFQAKVKAITPENSTSIPPADRYAPTMVPKEPAPKTAILIVNAPYFSLGTIVGAYLSAGGMDVELIDSYKEHVDTLNQISLSTLLIFPLSSYKPAVLHLRLNP
jgi:hypothetical protein